MNKLVKGSIAGAAGIALLLGGAGTLALWNDSVGLSAATITTGELDIATTGTPAWADVSTKTIAGTTTSSVIGTGTTFTPGTHKLVPGDTLTYTQSVTIKAQGKNLQAKLAYLPGSVVIPAALTGVVTTTIAEPTGLPAGWTTSGSATDGWTITPAGATSTATFNVVLTIKFLDLPNATQAQVGQNLTAIDFTGAAFTLTQVRP